MDVPLPQLRSRRSTRPSRAGCPNACVPLNATSSATEHGTDRGAVTGRPSKYPPRLAMFAAVCAEIEVRKGAEVASACPW
jgi:hypothetical protein